MPLRLRHLRLPALLLGSLLIAGCGVMRLAAGPLEATYYRQGHGNLLVFLPGIEDRAADFARHGFVREVRARDLPLDMVAVDARLPHYLAHNFVARLRREVIQPAQRQGYRQIWLVGVSLGGMGAMLYADAHPGEIDGIIAIAPYLGGNELAQEIEAAGGLEHWSPGLYLPGDFRPAAWRWLKDYRPDGAGPTLVLAYGRDDRFSPGHRLLDALLPASRVVHQPGGHDWATWQQLWQATLTRMRDTLGPQQLAQGETSLRR